MKFIFLIIFFFNHSTWAKNSVSAQVFQTNVKPILSGIISDFYQMIGLFPGYPQNMIWVAQEFNKIEFERSLMIDSCQHQMDKNCLQIIDELRKKIGMIEEKTLNILSQKNVDSSLYLNNLIGVRNLSEMHADLIQFKYQLNNSSFIYRSNIKSKNNVYHFIKNLDELQAKISICLIEFMPHKYKEEFRGFYINFVHPIEKQIYRTTNYIYFNKNIDNLNFSLNLLNQNLTKRNKKTPEGMAPYLSTIHNKWNSIIRYYM
jgi:hypothetical protein